MPQAPLLPPGMRVREYVLLGRTPHIGSFGYEGQPDLEAVGAALERLDLGGARRPAAARRSPAASSSAPCSHARSRRMRRSSCSTSRPASLDLGRQQQALELVAGLREHGELTVLCAMHDLTLAAQYADRLLLLSRGRLVADGPPAEIATEALISAHYGADVRVVEQDGAVAVVPIRVSRAGGEPRRDRLDARARRHAAALGGMARGRLAPRARRPARLDEELPNWRALLERFAEDQRARLPAARARPWPAALRGLQADGLRIGVFTDAPEELARIAVAQLGAARRIEALEAGPGALERLLAHLGPDTRVARSLAELERDYGASQ